MLLRRLSNRLCAQCWCSKSVTIRITFRLSLPLEAADSLSAWCSTCGSSRSPSDTVGGSCGLRAEAARGGRASPWFQSLESTSKHAARTHVRLFRHDGLHKASCTWLIVAAPRRGGGGAACRRRGIQAARRVGVVLATVAMRVAPTEQEGLREQSSSVAPGRKFKVNDHSVRIPLAVVKLMRQPALRLSAGSCPPITSLLACSRAPWSLCLQRPGRLGALEAPQRPGRRA